jgi:predicted Zn-dependent protease
MSPEVALPKMREAASRAVELDGTLAEVHSLLAQARWYMEFDWVETEASLSRALALEPTNVYAITILSFFLQCSGRLEEGLELMKQAVAADPLNPVVRQDFAWRRHHTRRFGHVIEEANRIIQSDPGFAPAYNLLGSTYWMMGELEASHLAWRRYSELTGRPAWLIEAQERGYKLGGFKGRAEESLKAIRQHDDGSISHGVRAFLACMAEQPKEALVELEHALRRRAPRIVEIGTWPMYDCVRSDPRYQDLLRKINWPGLEG